MDRGGHVPDAPWIRQRGLLVMAGKIKCLWAPFDATADQSTSTLKCVFMRTH